MPTITIVDDDAHLREALALRLRAAGFEVFEAESPATAQPLLLHNPPDLILLDIDMPHYSGLEFHECLKLSPRTRDIPVVYLSGCNSPIHVREALKNGARAYLTKPYDPRYLVATLRDIVGLQPASPAGAEASS